MEDQEDPLTFSRTKSKASSSVQDLFRKGSTSSTRNTDQIYMDTYETTLGFDKATRRKPIYNLSLFGHNTGIFHRGHLVFKSQINVLGSILVLFIAIPFIILKFYRLGTEVSMSTYFKKVSGENLE